MGDITKDLSRSAITCKCGCGFSAIDPHLATDWQTIRDEYGKPIPIDSGGRCVKHNEEVYEEKRKQFNDPTIKTVVSSHLPGVDGNFHALDLKCITSQERWELLSCIFYLIRTGKIGLLQVEMCPSWIHIANDLSKGHNIAYYGK